MTEYYTKIECPWLRDPETHKLIPGAWRDPAFAVIGTWQATVKIDGTNVGFRYSPRDESKFSYHGRTRKTNFNASQRIIMQSMLDQIKYKLDLVVDMTADWQFYAELYGGDIQNGGNYGQLQLVFFDIKCNSAYLARADVEDICSKLELPVVPVVSEVTTVEQAIEYVKTERQDPLAKDARQLEGLVLRTEPRLWNSRGHAMIMKVKHRDFKD